MPTPTDFDEYNKESILGLVIRQSDNIKKAHEMDSGGEKSPEPLGFWAMMGIVLDKDLADPQTGKAEKYLFTLRGFLRLYPNTLIDASLNKALIFELIDKTQPGPFSQAFAEAVVDAKNLREAWKILCSILEKHLKYHSCVVLW